MTGREATAGYERLRKMALDRSEVRVSALARLTAPPVPDFMQFIAKDVALRLVRLTAPRWRRGL